MNGRFLVIGTFLVIAPFCGEGQCEPFQNKAKTLFSIEFRPKSNLQMLLELTGMKSSMSEECTIEEINAWVQQHFLRYGERWQEQSNRYEKLRPQLMPLLKQLGFVEPVVPLFKKYRGAIVHGGMLMRVRLRLHFLVEQWKNGVRFSHLYFLSGERPLEVQYENRETFVQADESLLKIKKDWILSEVPTTECEMVRLIWEQSDIPDDMRAEVAVYFIDAPMKMDSKDVLLRPTTDDTIVAWLKTTPPFGRYFAVTEAPYINRQDLVMQTFASPYYTVETVGAGAKQDELMAIFLDELARCIYQIRYNFPTAGGQLREKARA